MDLEDKPPLKRQKVVAVSIDNCPQDKLASLSTEEAQNRISLDKGSNEQVLSPFEHLSGVETESSELDSTIFIYGTVSLLTCAQLTDTFSSQLDEIENIHVLTLGQSHWNSIPRDRKFFPLILESSTNNVTVRARSGEVWGTLSSVKRALQEVSVHDVQIQAYVDMEASAMDQSESTFISINVYGLLSLATTVGDILTKHRLFLQDPKRGAYDRQHPYHNPQCLFQNELIYSASGVEENAPRNKNFSIRAILSSNRDMLEDILPSKVLEFNDDSLQISEKIKTNLLKHQRSAVNYMLGTERAFSAIKPDAGGILADAPGLGKSLTSLALIASSLSNLDHSGCGEITLLVVPNFLISSWESQISDHCLPNEIRVTIYSGSNRFRKVHSFDQSDIVLTPYSTIVADWNRNGVRSEIFSRVWYRVILDEAHLIKDKSSRRFQAIYNLKTSRRWCLTGTPIQNRLEDLEPLLLFLRLEPFSQPGIFNKEISRPLKRGDRSALNHLHWNLRSIMIRRTKTMIDLPDRQELVVEVDLTESERVLYNIAKDSSKVLITHALSYEVPRAGQSILQSILMQRQIANHGSALLQGRSRNILERLANISRCAVKEEEYSVYCEACHREFQNSERVPSFDDCFHVICSNCTLSVIGSDEDGTGCPLCDIDATTLRQHHQKTVSVQAWINDLDYKGPSSKITALIENLKQEREYAIASVKPVKSIVFSEWVKMLHLVGLALSSESINFVRYDGTLSPDEREKALRDFRENRNISVLLMSIRSGGIGLNLTVASNVHLLEPQWNPMVETQALDRVHRIGQRNAVKAYRYIAKDTFDETIGLLQSRKLEIANLALAGSRDNNEQQRTRLKEIYQAFK